MHYYEKNFKAFELQLWEYMEQEHLAGRTAKTKKATRNFSEIPSDALKVRKALSKSAKGPKIIHYVPRKLLEMQDTLIKICKLENEVDSILDDEKLLATSAIEPFNSTQRTTASTTMLSQSNKTLQKVQVQFK